jgi:cytochrome c oxidase subunit 3
MQMAGAFDARPRFREEVLTMSAAQAGNKPYYFVPQPSYWPLVGSLALLLLGMGAALWMNSVPAGPWLVLAGFGVLLVMLFGWFGTVIGESEHRLYNAKVDMSFRWSMSWFIFSEVMFFAAFFGALFYVRNLSVPDLGSPTSKLLLWPDYTAGWPTIGPYIKEQFTPMGAIGIPLLNTIILLTSGFTLTVAHHALKAGHRGTLKLWLFATIVLGFTFLGFQAYEYIHAYHALNLKLTTGVYGSITTSRSRPRRGTGTSSTSSGCCCSSSSTGSDRAGADAGRRRGASGRRASRVSAQPAGRDPPELVRRDEEDHECHRQRHA